jgi:1,6-anhydro-N-acetylmuramate kinase
MTSASTQIVELHRRNQPYRLAIGLAIDASFAVVNGCLLLVQGSGKWMRRVHIERDQQRVPSVIAEACQALAADTNPTIGDWCRLRTDLADALAPCAQQLHVRAGRGVDRVLTIGVVEPGIWLTGDGQSVHQPLVDAHRLAELTGLAVVDGFPERDLANGGRGGPLEPWPLWYLLADRDVRVSRQARVLVRWTPSPQLIWLPPSDGWDGQPPDVRVWPAVDENSTGVVDDGILVKAVAEQVDQWADSYDELAILVDDGVPETISESLADAVPRAEVQSLAARGFQRVRLESLAAAMLGLMYLDHIPASLPHLTGASETRVLGRITAGSAANWRQVVQCLADSVPPVMRLRDAI